MVDVRDEDGHRTKRFKYQSYNEQLKDIHAPSVLERSKIDESLEGEECLFHAALTHWMQLNLSPSFVSFARKVAPLSQSLALLVHSWRDVTDLLIAGVQDAEQEALKALLDLFQKLVEDLRITLAPAYEEVITCLFALLPRRIAPEVLSVLLSALLSVFKHVTIPLSSEDLESSVLLVTWDRLNHVLAKCNSETQRTVAEVWSFILRRVKKDDRERCVNVMMGSAGDLNDFVAWSFVFASKSVAQTVHTCGSLLTVSCLEYYLVTSESELEAALNLLRRVLTALVHHCSKPEHFSVIMDPVMERFFLISEPEKVRRILDVLAVPCSVRQGSRLTPKQLSEILDGLQRLPYDEKLRIPFLTTITAVLSASSGDLSVWMGAGRRAIDYAWTVDSGLAVSLTGALLEVGWKGFTQFGLPMFLKKSLFLLDAQDGSEEAREALQVQTIRVLAKLVKNNMLKNVDDSWRSRLADWVRTWIEQFSASENSAVILAETTVLLPVLSSHSLLPPLISLVQQLMAKKSDMEAAYRASWANNTLVLGHILRTISNSRPESLPQDIDVQEIVFAGIQRWSWSEYIVESVAGLAKSCLRPRSNPTHDRDVTIDQLIVNLKSHSHDIRRSSLELLNLLWFTDGPVADAVKRCLAAEVVPLSVQGVRERVLLTGMVGQAALDDDRAVHICVAWLLGQLKAGLRPVWTPASQAMSVIAQRFSDIVWTMVYPELKNPGGSVITMETPEWALDAMEEEDGINEEERSWRDPSAHKFRSALSKWTSNSTCRKSLIQIQRHRDRFDTRSYESQLLVAIGEFPSIAEKHSRQLVPLFLTFAPSASSEKASRPKLVNWLKLFSKFSNPKAFYQSDEVHALYTSLLSHPDRNLQSVALTCLQTYKTPALSAKSDMLSNLLDDMKWRDEVTMLSLQELSSEERKDLVPVLIRMFYGMMRERGGRGKGVDKRSALLGALAACTEDELVLLVDLMVEPFREGLNCDSLGVEGESWRIEYGDLPTLPEKQQIGFLMLLADVLKILGIRVVKSWPQLVTVTITLAAHAQRELQSSKEDNEKLGDEDEGEKEGDKESDKTVPRSTTRLRQLRLVRQLGLKRLAEFFLLPPKFNFTPYISELFRTVISHRIPLLDRENTQSPSSLLELLNVWSMRSDTALYLVRYDEQTMTKVFDCLTATNVKPAVQTRVFDILERLLEFSAQDRSFSDHVLKPYMAGLLKNIATAIERVTFGGSASAIGGIAQREVSILSKLSPHITDGNQAAALLSIFLPQIRRPGKGIPEKSKIDILDTLCNLIPRIPDLTESRISLFSKSYETLSYLFQSLRGRQMRLALIRAFNVLTSIDTAFLPIADLLTSLNSYSNTRLDEPDFDRRLSAFAVLNEERWKTLSGKKWTPLLHNMLYFIQDEDELTIRTNASLSMKRFLEVLSTSQGDELQLCFVRIIFPGLKRNLRAKSDPVRAEVMSVLSFAVERCANVSALQEMRVLLAGGDDEASFFNNVYHVQVHRRTRALRRLAEFCDRPGFRSSTLQEIFVPVVNGFISGSGKVDHHLVNEAVTTLGRIAKHLAWPAYFALVQQYIRLATEKSAAERAYTRALVSVLDNFHFSMEDTFVEEHEEAEDCDERTGETKTTSATMKIHDAVVNRLLPTLLKHLEKRDELEDINRIPLAIGVAKVSCHLPDASRDIQVPRLLTVLSQVFRSRSQETRDVTRDTLCRIAVMLGSPYLSVIIRQLREALVRGPHLHVLAYVTHAILVHVTQSENVGAFDSLDDCVPDVVHVSAEVVFGESKKDVESEGFKTKMKEVKGSLNKGMDSFAILAKYITPSATSDLLLPIKAIMQETESAKMMQVVEEVLRRMAVGIIGNNHFKPSDLLVFCYTSINQNARFFQEAVTTQKRKQKKVNDATVQLKRKIDSTGDHYVHNSWRFVTFGLDLFNTAYRRGRFDLKDAEITARLEPMVNVIGNTLYSSNGSVVASGLKAAAHISKAPLKNVEKSLPIFVRQTLQIIRETGSTEADVVQTAFKTLAVIIRDVSSSQLKEKDLTFLLELLTPDLEEASRQTNAFALLRAIVSRKFVVPEIYDLMDRVGEIMVTSQSLQVQELCRTVLLQFLLEYPQGKNRLKQHFAFLVKNLSYVFESGRKSVLELINVIIMKFSDDIITEYAEMLFVALVLVIANDDSTKCREKAAQLVKALLERLHEEQRKAIVSHVHSWAAQHDKAALARVSSQVYGLILDTLKLNTKPYLFLLLDDVNEKIRNSATSLEEARDNDADVDLSASETDWQIPYQALTTLSKVVQHFPHIMSDHNQIPWASVSSLLLFPHAWVRTASSRLFGSLFSVTPVGPPDDRQSEDFPLSPAGMKELANAFSLQLKGENLDEALSLQIVKNLFYIGKCFYAIPVSELNDSRRITTEEADAGSGDSGSESEGDDASDIVTNGNPMPWLFSRLSYQARSAYISRINNPKQNTWFLQLRSVFQWFAAMASHMDSEQLVRFLPHILAPLYRVAEDDIIRDPAMQELKILASELQDLLQSKVGVTAFANHYSRIRQRISKVRQERKVARVLRRTVDPKGAEERKARRNIGKRKREKGKIGSLMDKKNRMRVSKRRRID